MKKLAVIDLGTNTFHLLIVEAQKGKPFKELFRKSTYVKLAENGIHQIGTAPFQRGLDTLQSYRSILDKYEVEDLKIFGTAALRTASNGLDFINQVKTLSNFDIQLIPGEEEARLIHQGVIQAVPFGLEKNLIIDIGGGSVEFIIADQDQVYWAQSFPIGVAVLYRDWQSSDPIKLSNIQQIQQFFKQELQPLLKALQNHQIPNIVGASGAFDVLQSFLQAEVIDANHSIIPAHNFPPFLKKILQKSLAQRFQMQDLPKEKAEMIVVALLLIDFILQKTQASNILVSGYAMKEGILAEMLK